MKTTIWSSALALSLAITSQDIKAAEPSGFPANATPAKETAIANWRAKRYGMFIHFGLSTFAEKNHPPPFAAKCTSTLSPGTRVICTTAGVLSPVFLRAPAGSRNTEARSRLSGSL